MKFSEITKRIAVLVLFTLLVVTASRMWAQSTVPPAPVFAPPINPASTSTMGQPPLSLPPGSVGGLGSGAVGPHERSLLDAALSPAVRAKLQAAINSTTPH